MDLGVVSFYSALFNQGTSIYYISENILFGTLGKKMMKAGKEKMFDTWMLEESDLVQAAAHSFGKRQLIDQSVSSWC